MKGKRPTPTHLKVLAGNPGKRPIRPERHLPAASKRRPAWIPAEDSEAVRAWKRITPALLRAGLLTELDVLACSLLCLAWSDYQRARGGKRGGAAALRGVVSLLGEFGMSPSSRTRVRIDPISEPDELDAFLGGYRPAGGEASW